MKNLGIVRCLDNLGRVTLPKELRRTFKINEGDPVEIYVDGDVICIKPFRLKCVCCGSMEEDKLVQVNGVHMCPDCIREYYKGVKH